MCAPLLAKPSAAQLPAWQLIQQAATTPADDATIRVQEHPRGLVLSSPHPLRPLFTRSARRGDHAVVQQIRDYCSRHFASHPRTTAMATVDPPFFKVMVASFGDADKDMGLDAVDPSVGIVANVARACCMFRVCHLVSSAAQGYPALNKELSLATMSLVVASVAMRSLPCTYSRTGWDTWVAVDANTVSPAIVATVYCDLLGHHATKLPLGALDRLGVVHAALSSEPKSDPLRLPPRMATNPNLWTSLVEAAIRADAPHLGVPALQSMGGSAFCPPRTRARSLCLPVPECARRCLR